MARVLNETDKNLMLDKVLPHGEVYSAKMWATITVQKTAFKKLEILGGVFAKAPRTCYVGLTDNKIVITVTKLLRISKIKEVHVLDIDKIKDMRVLNSLLVSQGKNIIIDYDDNKTYEIFTSPSTHRTDVIGQEEAIETFLDRFFVRTPK